MEGTPSCVLLFLTYVRWLSILGLSLNVRADRNKVSSDTTVTPSGVEVHPFVIEAADEDVKRCESRNRHTHNPNPRTSNNSKMIAIKRFWWFLEKIYSLFVLLCIWFSFGWTSIILALSVHQLSVHNLHFIVTSTWTFQSAIMSAIVFWSGFSDWLSHITRLLDLFHVHASQAGLKSKELFLKLKKHLFYVTVINVVVGTAILPTLFYTSAYIPMTTLSHNSSLDFLFFRIGVCFSVVSWINIIVFLTILVHIFRHHFRFLSDVLKRQLSENEDDFYRQLRSHRRMYQTLVDAVHVADKYLRLISGTQCLFFIGTLLLSFFAMARVQNSFKIVMAAAVLSTVLFGAAVFEGCRLYEQVCDFIAHLSSVG